MNGVMLSELYSPNIPTIFEKCGFEFFLVDCEHGSFDYSQILAMSRVSANRNIEMFLRVPGLSREYFNKYLDMGITGLVVPMISNAAQALLAVEYSKYAPIGKRGLSLTRAHTEYCGNNFKEYMEKANKRVKLFIQIETREAIENVDELASIKGIDGLIIGPNDLSCDMDCYNQYDSDEFTNAIRKVATAAIRNNITAGIITSNTNLLATCINIGYTFICEGSEIRMLLNYNKEKR